jgi:hypothetical protein
MDTNNTKAIGYNLPPFFAKDKVVIVSVDRDKKSINTNGLLQVQNQYPLTFKCQGLTDFTFPIDPVITLGFKNVITRRTVSKGTKRGSVKEHWTEDDVDITISGVFISDDDTFPKEVNQVREFFKQHQAIEVYCTLLNDRDIDTIAIESFDLPFTKGICNQAFEIKAYSDDAFKLLIEDK